MTTIPVERKKIESWLTGLQCGVISQRHVFEDLRALLSEQPQADHSAQDLNMVEQPQAGAGEHDPMRQLANTYKATAMMLSDEVRRLREALELIADTDPDDGTSWFHDVANAALTQSPKGEEE